jgi:hypothetical protein
MADYALMSGGFIRRVIDGAVLPPDPANTDYAAFLAWQKAGNAPDPAPVAPKPTVIPSGVFIDRFTQAEQIAIQSAIAGNPIVGLGLTRGLAKGQIDLAGAEVTAWMAKLVQLGLITQARSTEIATP